MTQVQYDLLIVGGGPGGSCAAACARQRGLRTLVVEKAEFPRFHIGESLLPMGNAVLRETGAWPKVVAGGFIPKYGAEFHTADGSLSKTVVFSQGLIPGLESAFQVDRARFDALLLDHARSLGAEVRMKTAVQSITPVEGGNRVILADATGEQTFVVPWVIDCSGRESSLVSAQKRELDAPVFPKRLAVFSHFEGVARADGPERGNILVVRIPDGWFWLIPIDERRTSVGLVVPLETFRTAGVGGEPAAQGGEGRRSPEAFFARAVSAAPKVRERMARATRTMEFHVASDYSYFRRSLAGERMVLAGDAAGFLDPVFSSGVHLATSSGRKAVELIARAHAERRPLTAGEQAGYTRRVKRHTRVFERLIQAFYDDDAFEVFMCQTIPWDLARGLTSIVAGHADLTWPLWWRYQFFLLVCRLQRRWKLVRRPEPMDASAAPASPNVS